jgi:hypothetical protein
MHYPYRGPIPPKRTEDKKPARFTRASHVDEHGNPTARKRELGKFFDDIGEPTKLPRGTPRD